eukprot:COSAG01_NODE_19184_length_1025_cov_1.875810_1_plen_74_part_00
MSHWLAALAGARGLAVVAALWMLSQLSQEQGAQINTAAAAAATAAARGAGASTGGAPRYFIHRGDVAVGGVPF